MHDLVSQRLHKPEPTARVPTRPLCNRVPPAPSSELHGREKLGITTLLAAPEHPSRDAEVCRKWLPLGMDHTQGLLIMFYIPIYICILNCRQALSFSLSVHVQAGQG